MSRFSSFQVFFTGVICILGVLAACSSSNNGEHDSATTTTTAPEWPQSDVTIGPLVSGAASSIGGARAWTDFVYDDRGPNTDPGDMTDIASAGGDARYPDNLSNAADFVQVQIGDSQDGLRIRVVLQTLIDPAVPLVGIAFDTDDNSTTGAPRLPGSWEPEGVLGLELLLVMTAGAGQVLAWDEGNWRRVAGLEISVDTLRNTLDTTLPPAVAAPGDATWRAIGVAGTTAASWLSGAGVIHDLAFVNDEPFYQWQDYRQADILAGKAPVDAATATIDFGALARGSTELPESTTPGFHTYLYFSGLNLAEGIVSTGDGPEFLGPYQPYLVYVPEGGHREGDAMTLFLHGLTQNHLGSVLLGDVYLGTGRVLSEEIGALEPYARDGLDFSPYNLTVWPLARGAALYYEGIAEQDVLDVLDDARLRLRPDPDRVILSGASMGGIGAFRLGALYPDLWSVAVPIIGYARTAVEPLLPNFENLEILQINGALDPLIPMELASGTTDLIDAMELRFRAWMLDDRGHEAGGYVYDCVYSDLANYVRVTNPPRVRYTVDPANFVIDPEIGIELVHDRAYWVSGITIANRGFSGSVDAHSLALEQREVIQLVRTDERYDGGDAGRDLCGPNPDITTGDTWRYRALERRVGDETPTEKRLDIELLNLASATFDLARAGLAGGEAAQVRVTTDAAAEIVLSGLVSGQAITVNGATVTADADGSAEISIAVGTSVFSIAAT